MVERLRSEQIPSGGEESGDNSNNILSTYRHSGYLGVTVRILLLLSWFLSRPPEEPGRTFHSFGQDFRLQYRPDTTKRIP
jgi:hypothetical protein